MTEVVLTAPTSPEALFRVLADGWSYASWVVGAAHIREVDADWPAPGSRIHHSVGPWPLVVQDVTTVRAVHPPNSIELGARLWPVGEALIRLELTESGPDSTEIRMVEQIVRGPGRVLPDSVQALALVPRNRESLRRLVDMAVGKQKGH
jgi:Activator of Hsp90 ATPase homolog 1-like protein